MIRWAYAFVDRPRDRFPQACAFWAAVTGSHLSAPRGATDEFVTLLPPDPADAYVKAQAVDGGPGGTHLDLAVDDVAATAAEARALGAAPVHAEDGLEVLRSPAGVLFCVVPWSGETSRPAPLTAPDGTVSILDQVCVDIPPQSYDTEITFWATLTGWESTPSTRPEFHRVTPPRTLPLRLLLQRLESPSPAGAHLDLACSSPDAVRARHETLGATYVSRGANWLVMRDPAGVPYCLTGRDPGTGGLP
ncbi:MULTISPECIES: VOC family protein [Streptomyces]|uniref:Glyoxalase-like domain-containing protein n=1 Tax=Streptomyces venezuelae TaxID=54571 RepID=A0A5P2BK75_STRVZ|nr:VOC family protein [Streptomyces venezuelae]MYY81983.1 VOC family protein [Streptomyces sp. SID335]MYZ15560.1 VOC family protein [Streptomyces sp. SID337]NDZ92104.1 VOC family protein [Streptomyces sp. SID10115]NEA02260.1 VOC family protein [Streptomyces sp. SID10116]NEB44003.1 VOC family protein [Streptomyces sp. SID339]